MQWILDNWLLVLLIGAMVAMHLGHGMHGSKNGHGAGESSGHGDDRGAGHGTCKSTGKKCCGGHKKKLESDLKTEPASTSKPVTGKSKIPKISYSADEAENSSVL